MYRNSSILDDIRSEFRTGNIVTLLIIVNVGVFLFVNLVNFILLFVESDKLLRFNMFNDFLAWFALPIDPGLVLLKPWTAISHMFLHASFGHIFWNMLYLFWFGKILRLFLGDRKILPIYIYGGLVGALAALLAYNLIPAIEQYDPAQIMLGASAGIMAIVAAAGTIAPNYTIFLFIVGQVRLKYIALFVVVLDVIALPYFSNTGGHIAHLGGALLGFLFIRQLQAGNDWSIRFNKIIDWFQSLTKSNKGPRVHYKSTKKEKASRETEPANVSKQKQDKIDRILDKIAQSGYDSLSAAEKEFLFRVSNDQE